MVKNVLIILLECGHSQYGILKKQLFISRDPFGEKPLYYYIDKNGFFLALK